jgi:hypothetical protein
MALTLKNKVIAPPDHIRGNILTFNTPGEMHIVECTISNNHLVTIARTQFKRDAIIPILTDFPTGQAAYKIITAFTWLNETYAHSGQQELA